MNLSGKAVRYWVDKEKIALDQTLTVVDELALPLNKLRLRTGGSHAGHNGLFDIQNILGTDKYPKLRFGIGNTFPKGMQVEYVLGKWFPEEQAIVKEKIEKCIEVIENVSVIGFERTMNIVNSIEFGK
jgi:PTH1 family peptidyl-tRNA hydrolase